LETGDDFRRRPDIWLCWIVWMASVESLFHVGDDRRVEGWFQKTGACVGVFGFLLADGEVSSVVSEAGRMRSCELFRFGHCEEFVGPGEGLIKGALGEGIVFDVCEAIFSTGGDEVRRDLLAL